LTNYVAMCVNPPQVSSLGLSRRCTLWMRLQGRSMSEWS